MKKIILSLGVWLLPALVFAQNQTITGILGVIKKILNTVIPILITLGVVYFIWGVITYVTAGDEEKRKEGRQRMIYGIIGLFVIISIWGLVGVLATTFGIGPGGTLGPGDLPGVYNP